MPNGPTTFRDFTDAQAAYHGTRRATDAEAQLFGAAIDHGAYPVGFGWRAWVSGQHVEPVSWGLMTPFVEDLSNPVIVAACDEKSAQYDAFYARLRGDLAAVVARVNAERAGLKVAA